MRKLALTVILASCCSSLPAQASSTWPQFLGDGGLAQASGAKTLSFDRDKDLQYRVELPPGESSACIWEGQIFLTGLAGDQLVMFALDRETGKEQWRHAVPAPKDAEFMHADASVAMPTACSNGERVFFYFPSYGLIARNMDGELAWEKRLPDPKAAFGTGSSPMIFEDMVLLLRDGCPDAALYALYEESGEEVWTLPRMAFSDSHTTPFIWENRDRIELIIASTGSVISLDPYSGEEVWRVEGLTPLVCTTPTADADHLFFAGWSTPAALGADKVLAGMENPIEITEEERNDPAVLFKRFDANADGKVTFQEIPAGRASASFTFLDGDGDGVISLEEWAPFLDIPAMGENVLVAIKPGGEGNVTETHVDWTVKRGIPYVSSPLLYNERLYLIKAGGILSCFNPTTGEPIFRRSRLDDRSEYYATPLGVDGHVVICSSAGTVFVLEAADEMKVLRSVDFEEKIFATPAVVDGTVYLRTRQALYAFGSGE